MLGLPSCRKAGRFRGHRNLGLRDQVNHESQPTEQGAPRRKPHSARFPRLQCGDPHFQRRQPLQSPRRAAPRPPPGRPRIGRHFRQRLQFLPPHQVQRGGSPRRCARAPAPRPPRAARPGRRCAPPATPARSSKNRGRSLIAANTPYPASRADRCLPPTRRGSYNARHDPGHGRRRLYRLQPAGGAGAPRPRDGGGRIAWAGGPSGATSPSTRRRGSSRRPTSTPSWRARPPLEMVYHLGAISDTTATDGDLRVGDQRRTVADASGSGAPNAGSAWSTPPRPPPMATARPASTTTARPPRCERLRPLNLYGWTKHAFDLLRGARRRGAPAAPAAMGGAQVLQRLRPERVPQGPDDLGGQGQARRSGRRRPGPAVPLDRARTGRWRAAARLHLDRRRGRRAALAAGHARRERAVQPRHRPGTQLSRSGACGVRRGGPAAQDRVHRHARGAARPIPVVHPGRDGPACAPPAMPGSSPRSRKVCGAMSRII